MENKSKHRLILAAVMVVIIAVSGVLAYKGKGAGNSNLPAGKYDEFAKCLKAKGAVFYGAFWCSHCQNQKKAFGSAVEFLLYVECSTPDKRGQLQACVDAKIEGYPTWVFPDGSRQAGEVSFETLASKTGCILPQ